MCVWCVINYPCFHIYEAKKRFKLLSGSQFRWGLPQIDAELLTEKWVPAGIKKPWQSWQDLYEVLGLPEDADEATIKKAGNRYGQKNDSVVWVQAGWLDRDRWYRYPNAQINNWFFEASEIQNEKDRFTNSFWRNLFKMACSRSLGGAQALHLRPQDATTKNHVTTHHGLTPWWVEGKIEPKLGEFTRTSKGQLHQCSSSDLFDNDRTEVPCSTNRMVTNPKQFALRSTESFRFSFLAKEMPEIPQRPGQIPSLRLT